MHQHGLGAFRVVLGRVNAAAVGYPHHQGAGESAARTIAHAGYVANDLVKSRVEKPHELDFGNRPQPRDGHAHRHADDAGLGNRRIHDARPSVACL